MELLCERCVNYTFDDEAQAYFCAVNLDEDDYVSVITSKYKRCPFYRSDDDYAIVKKQN